MEGVPALREIMEKEDYICKIDLKDAYVRNGLPIQDSSIWNERKSKDFQQNDETRNGTFEKTRHPLGLLFGRHLHSREISGENESSHRTSYYSLGELGLFDQQKKEYINPIENTGIPRLYVQHKDNEDFSSREKNIQIKEPNKSSISHIKNKNMQMAKHYYISGICKET
ncbi:hypothetical protein G6F68_009669 [Rhizopus microsporus]|nr:hypothetical protein G6F68_009669 [Rhizopus microsporus]